MAVPKCDLMLPEWSNSIISRFTCFIYCVQKHYFDDDTPSGLCLALQAFCFSVTLMQKGQLWADHYQINSEKEKICPSHLWAGPVCRQAHCHKAAVTLSLATKPWTQGDVNNKFGAGSWLWMKTILPVSTVWTFRRFASWLRSHILVQKCAGKMNNFGTWNEF